jgi:hypothetical protein
MGFASLLIVGDVAVMFAGIGLGHQYLQLLSLHFCSGVPEDTLGCGVEQVDATLTIDGNYGILSGVNEAP